MENMQLVGTQMFTWGVSLDADFTNFIRYNGKFYPGDASGLKALGCDMAQQGNLVAVSDEGAVEFRSNPETRLPEQEEIALFTKLYTQICAKHGIELSRGREADPLNSSANTPEFIAKETVREISAIHLAAQEPSGRIHSLLRTWKKWEGEFDRIDHILQKARVCGYAFKVRRILAVSFVALAAITAGVPMLLTVPLVRCMVRLEQKSDLMIIDVRSVGEKSTDAILNIETSRQCGIWKKAVLEFQIRPEMYSADHGRKEWLRLFRTIVSDHDGLVQLGKYTHHIDTYTGYLEFVATMLTRMHAQTLTRSSDFKAMLCEMPTYSQAIPTYARVVKEGES